MYKTKHFPTLQLLLGIVCIWMIIWILVPLFLQQTETEVMQMIQDKGYDTSALFYTDSEKAVESNYEMMKDKK